MAAAPIVIQKKKGRGCCGCGSVILLLIVALFIFIGYLLHQWLIEYTSRQPAVIATTDRGPAVFSNAQRKLNAFTEAFEHLQPARLHLNADEINTLVAREPSYAKLRGHFHIEMHGDQAVVQSSFQLGEMGDKWVLPDHYLNSVTTLGLSFDPATHALIFDFRGLQLNGLPLTPNMNQYASNEANTFVNAGLEAQQITRDLLARTTKVGVENSELVVEIK
jgi:hypothetical protein